jgi:hypothetical protein
MESVRIAEITLAKQGFRYFQEPHFAWHVNKKRNDAEFIPAQVASHLRLNHFSAGLPFKRVSN